MRKRVNWKKIFEYVIDPPTWVVVLTFALTLNVSSLSVIAAASGAGLSLFAFVLYAVAFVCWAYSVYLCVNIARKVKGKVLFVADKYKFTRNLHKDYEFRTIFFGVCSLAFNAAYTVFLCLTALYADTFWYWVLAGYYILLTSIRAGVLADNRKNEKRYGGEPLKLQKEKVTTYRSCGLALFALTVVLAAAVGLMVVDGERFPTPKVTVYALGIYAGYRIVMAVYNLIKVKKYDDLVVRAVRNINFATALVSFLSFQTVLLDMYEFAYMTELNLFTGITVCLLVLTLGVYMTVYAGRVNKEIARRETEMRERFNGGEGYNREDYGLEYGRKEEGERFEKKE